MPTGYSFCYIELNDCEQLLNPAMSKTRTYVVIPEKQLCFFTTNCILVPVYGFATPWAKYSRGP